MPKKKTKGQAPEKDEKLTRLLDHYSKATRQMDVRRTRKNGWNDIINAYMSKLPANWPYTAMVTAPMVRTTILEKNSRLINAKLQGRLVPREGGDVIKAKIQNALLDYQWDAADKGGSMIEKVAKADQYTRLFGASFVYTYWDNEKNTNEVKLCDPRDVLIDWGANHVRNAKWLQYREFTTLKSLEERGFDVKTIKDKLNSKEDFVSDLRSTKYEDQVFINRGLEDLTGQDLSNPVIEIVTEWTPEYMCVFAPRYGVILKDGPNPYKHGKIPFAMLRYYPLVDDIYGESEVESAIPLQRTINAMLSGFVDQSNLSMRPPIKVVPTAARIETIEYGPGALWVTNDINAISEHNPNTTFIQTFNVAFPSLIMQFNQAMGDNSQYNLASANLTDKPTATQVKSDVAQQNVRDQANQVYLSEFLKDLMMMWVSNNKQYLFDNPNKQHFVLKVVGKENIDAFSKMQLDDKDIPDFALNEVAQTVMQHPQAVSPDMISNTLQDLAVPQRPIDTGGDNFVPKLDKVSDEEANLYVEKSDFEGVYDYIPDVKSMSAGAGTMQQQARSKAYELILANPLVQQLLLQQGETLKVKELLVNILTDAGERDAEGLFQSAGNPGAGVIPGGPAVAGPGLGNPGVPPAPGMGEMGQTVPNPAVGGGIPQTPGL